MRDDVRIDLAEIRETLAASEGKRFWRSLEEVADTEAFRDALHREFPENASEWDDPVGRRRFLTLMGASIALAGVTGCTRQPKEEIWPYAQTPESTVPGRPTYFATAVPFLGYAQGVLVESHMGRPTKIEGNPDHPASLGGTDAFAQAAILGLYDPDRSQTIRHLGEIRTWAEVLETIRGLVESLRLVQGDGLRILTETVTSPTLAEAIRLVLAALPQARWHQYEPLARDHARAGAIAAFGEPVSTYFRFDRADVVLSLDADFISSMPGSVRYVRDFVGRRKAAATGGPATRLYVAESAPTLTGAAADHRLPVRAREVEALARALAFDLGVPGAAPFATPDDRTRGWIAAVARDLKSHAGACLVIAGDTQPPAVHALAHAINHALGNAGRTLVHVEPVEAAPVDHATSLRELTSDMEAGHVSCLLVLGANPAYHAPADVGFAAALEKVALRMHLGMYNDETAAHCHWHVPEAHPLESWGDARAHDGTVTIIQPLTEPLFDGKTTLELLAAFHGQPGKTSHELVRAAWSARWAGASDVEQRWRRALRDGVVAGTASPEMTVVARPVTLAAATPIADSLEILFRPDPTVLDGRFANIGWLQELPKPLTKLTWDNAVMVAPATAQRLKLADGDVVELAYRGRTASGPVRILPGQPDNSITLHLGYGRTRAGRVGDGAGFDANVLRTSDAPWFGSGLTVRKSGGREELAQTQEHHSMEGRDLVRRATLEEFLRDPHAAEPEHAHHQSDLSLFPRHAYEGHAWGMAIDLNACVGCNACVVACQSENNIPVVGKDQVSRGREMHWIRIDRYFEGSLDAPEVHHQPIPCMHCENAPCESVCPVAATVHSSEGLNDMVYNRCVGTRYCSNNCPYKVRRFNFYLYQDWKTPTLKMMRNPDVSVRSRGVMEKCTYCVQRINGARNQAKLEDREIRDGDIVTACQQACPADAIRFGDINDPGSGVSAWKSDPRNYGILTELNTRPRTTYLAALRNPNPEIESL